METETNIYQNTKELIVDSEFQKLIPALNPEEKVQLEKNIVENGCLDSIKVWNNIVIDGHNRYEICSQNNIAFTTLDMQFDNREAVKEWIIKNQFGRRNISTYQRAVLALELEEIFKARAKDRLSEAGTIGRVKQLNNGGLQISANPILDKIDTREELAKIANTSHDTIQKVKVIQAKAPEVIKQKVQSGEITINEAYISSKAIDKLPDNQKAVVISKIESGKVDSVGMAVKQLREEEKIKEYKKEVVNKPIIHNVDFYKFIDTIPDNYFDMLLTDPLYFTDVDNINTFSNWIYSVKKKVKDTGSMYVCIGSYQEEILAYLTKDITDFELVDILVWTYNNATVRQPDNKYIKNYQFVLYYRGKNAPAINKPANCTEQFASFTINAPDGRQANRYHAWQKPDDLADRFILNSSKEGDLIFDPFACTGTFLLRAAALGRKAIGCEIDKSNYNIAIERGCINE